MKYISILFFLISFNMFSQSITGIVLDGDNNEALPFANVSIKGTKTGATTDIDGKFEIKVAPGTYTVIFSFIGYSTVQMSDVIVKSNKETFIQVTLKPESNQLEDIVITTTSKKNSEASLLNLQKKSISLVDGLSIQSIKKAGDSDVAGAIKRVPGISVQGGKYIYVRGLGDRYSKTTLNGMELPGLDPDRNTIPMDIFPTNLIENILVKKSASSEIGADFTGGTVDINLKDFSFSPEYTINFTAGYNPDMHFNSNFIADVKSSSDWRGKDDGLRDIPFDQSISFVRVNPSISAEDANNLTESTRKLTKTLKPIQQRSDLNYNFGFSASNGYKFKKDGESTIGYIAAIGYKSETSFLNDFYRANVIRTPNDGVQNELVKEGIFGTINTYLSTLLGVTYKDSKNKISVNFIDLQNGESNALELESQGFIENVFWGEESTITYTERNLRSIPIGGKHTIGDNLFTVDWKFAPSKSTLQDKDFRTTIFETDADKTFYLIGPNPIASPSRLWRDLDETSTVGKLDIEIPIQISNISGKISLGASKISKERDFNSRKFDLIYHPRDTGIFGGDPNAILAEENIWVQLPGTNPNSNRGTYITGGPERTNIYNSKSENDAYYLSSELKFSEKFKSVVGVRFENYQLRYTGEDLEGNTFDNELFIDDKDLFTNINLIFSPNEKSNVRASYYKTTARPSFREASASYLIDPVTQTFFLGNPEIRSAYINNYDLRYEFFGEKNEMFALSLFSKSFKDPIEIAVVSDDTPNDFTARNNDKATVRGVEFELRKNLLTLNNLTFNVNSNVSFISAKQTMNEDEYQARLELAKEAGVEISRERELQGQSPYMINIGLLAVESEKEIEAGLYYNVQGPTLEFVGAGGVPDIYSEPFHNLDFSASKVFNGKKLTKKITFRAKNILQDKTESYYVLNKEKSNLFRSFSPGIIFSLGVSLTFK